MPQLSTKHGNSLILNEKLDEYRSYQANDELVRWERITKEAIEKKLSNYETYLKEEDKYNISN